MRVPVVVSWSGGKDSALALAEILRDDRYRVTALLTTVTAVYDRISMHGVRRRLLRRQAQSLRLPLQEVVIPQQASNEEYEDRMLTALRAARATCPGLETVMFGDLFLSDVRSYRERMLGRVGMKGLFPIWGRDTRVLAERFVGEGYRAVLACVDLHALPAAFAGREFDETLLSELPPGVDPCGENGEFHTFVYAGPDFGRAIPHRRGEIVVRDGRFVYCDLIETDRA
jgi:uncharacterized protein (TIGR00290 family)